MSIRIYSLAKELKLDNKVLVDICNKIGITGKGSALASLSEEEAAAIKAHLGKKGGAAAVGEKVSSASTARLGGRTAAAAAPSVVRREDYVGPAAGGARKVPVLDRRAERPGAKKSADQEIAARRAETASPAVAEPDEELAAETAVAVEPEVETPVAEVAEAPVMEQPEVEQAAEAEATVAEPEQAPVEEPAAAVQEETPVESAPEVAPPVVVEEASVAEVQAKEAPQAPAEAPPAAKAEPPKPATSGVSPRSPASTAPKPPPTAPKPPPTAPKPPPTARPPIGKPEAPVRPERPEGRGHLEQQFERLMPLRPGSGKSADRGDKPARPRTGKSDRPERGPSIKLAPMPAAQQPPPSAKKSSEPAPQKPDIKLPLDAIRASKAGLKPLAEQLRKHEEKKRAATGKKPGKREDEAAATPPAAGAETPESAAAALLRERSRRGVKPAGEGEEEFGSTLGGREQRQLKRKRTTPGKRRSSDEEEGSGPRELRRLRRTGHTSTAAPRKSRVVLEIPCTIRSFAEALGLPVQAVMGKLMELGMMMPITATLNAETAELLAEAMGAEVDFREQLDLEDRLIPALEGDDDPERLQPRPPVITFLGHVDHGKTSLLDKILGLNVAAGEKGGITQHIRAYQIDRDGRKISFVDTPGHEAFTSMRARGAQTTDIAVLVVAADDGMMPQTEEALSHARAAGVPIVVAMNKIDLPGIKIDRVMQQLAANELLPSEWGGDTEVVQTSAMTGKGIDDLLETILTVAELREYAADPDRAATGVCLEAEVQQGRGVVAKFLVQKGTLRPGDIVVCGPAHGRVKAMYDTLNAYKKHNEAGPSMPVNITGLDVAPGAGDRFHVLTDIAEAREIAASRAAKNRQQTLAGAPAHITLETLHDRLQERDQVRTLNIILRADVRGSIEAILKELTKLEHPEVQVKVLMAGVGGVTEGDVHLADASDAVIIGFNVVPDERARELADRNGVQIRRYDIIYQVTEDLRAALEGMLKPEKREADLGRALVQRLFHISRVGTVAGCRVMAGVIQRDCRVRLIRDSRIIGEYSLDTLKREKDDAREVREGLECGIKLSGFNDLKEGDVFEAYKVEEIRRTF